jgi:glycosyltransferase involved in cell wall biosynthesis
MTAHGARPKISVCMASYNGARFIAPQMHSILTQLSDADEVIVVDDASTDDTREVVRSFCDKRLQLVERVSNQGVLRSFEQAIQLSVGEIIFLADQDDLWVDDKISTVMEAFRANPKVDIVVSDASLMNEDGTPLAPSYYGTLRKFRSGVFANLIHCSYLGCTMALRSRVRTKVLPFPKHADVLHDLWIGTLNSLLGGETLYVDRPLVRYRRHSGNSTGNSKLPFARQFRIRWDLCRSLAAAWVNSRASA